MNHHTHMCTHTHIYQRMRLIRIYGLENSINSATEDIKILYPLSRCAFMKHKKYGKWWSFLF